MWKLKEIYAQNVCAFRELHYPIQQGVTTLIFGNNKDNDGQRSNGSGKSAFLECLALGCTGSSLRKVKNEEIINDHSDECFVELTFENDSMREVFVVERRLYRKHPAFVGCRIIRDGKEVTTDETVQPSVDAYNKYILEKLGITKEELFNNFLLCRHKYQDFLSSSDREKKEIINRFSNGVLVDQAIEHILKDKEPLEKRLQERCLELAKVDGRIEVLTEQTEKAEHTYQSDLIARRQKILEVKDKITEKQDILEEKQKALKQVEAMYSLIKKADDAIVLLENGDRVANECLPAIVDCLSSIGCSLVTNWDGYVSEKKEKLNELEREFSRWNDTLAEEGKSLSERIAKHDALKEQYFVFHQNYSTSIETYKNSISSLEKEIEDIEKEIKTLKGIHEGLLKRKEQLHNLLAGLINCPSCAHRFSLANKDFKPDAARLELSEKKEEIERIVSAVDKKGERVTSIHKEIASIQEEEKELRLAAMDWETRLKTSEEMVSQKQVVVKSTKEQRDMVATSIRYLTKELQDFRRSLFDEAFQVLDTCYKNNERQTQAVKEDIRTTEGNIESLETMLNDLRSISREETIEKLKASLKESRKESGELAHKKQLIENELKTLHEQEENFTAFKTYLANTKIEALSKITNEFLENIGSDIRIRFSGYTILKSGKIREKISISLLRGGVDCGSFGKFSAGEAARVNLATILAMQKLINSNCEDGKGLDLLVLDEILEAVDEEGLACMFSALNQLGITALVVSHGNIAESYPYTIKVTKEHGESTLEA